MTLSHSSLKPQRPEGKQQLPDIPILQGEILDYPVGFTKEVDKNLFGSSQPNTRYSGGQDRDRERISWQQVLDCWGDALPRGGQILPSSLKPWEAASGDRERPWAPSVCRCRAGRYQPQA